MPRGARKHANQHNPKHENGVVAPGKRVQKQKSNGQLNGPSEGPRAAGFVSSRDASDSPASAPTAVAPVANGTIFRRTSSQASKTAAPQASPATTTPTDAERSGSWDMAGHRNTTDENGAPMCNHTVKHSPASPSHAPVEAGPFQLALTVLQSCPLRDTLAILIFLLSLPPTILNITNTIFMALTVSLPSGLPTFADVMSAPSPGVPSLALVLLIDVIAWFLFAVVFTPLQTFLLDCAQAMVATTLGGRAGSRPGATADSTMQCVGIVLVLQLPRHRDFILQLLHRTWLWRWLPETASFTYFDDRPSYVLDRNRRGTVEAINILIALHIVCQGFTRVVRQLLYTKQKSTQPPLAGADPEAVAGSQPSTDSQEPAPNQPSTPLGLRSIASLQHLREGKDKISSGKRRKKQGNYVRSQQPLWAAFAATKATIMREYVQSLATTEAIGSDATDEDHLGDAQFVAQESRVWIVDVSPLNVFFETGPLPRSSRSRSHSKGSEDGTATNSAYPLSVCVNGSAWASVKVKEFPQSDDHRGQPRWTGEVYGLSPSSTYHVSFQDIGNGETIHTETVSTQALPVTESAKAPHAINLQIQTPTSPTSPTSTLKASILAVENSINEVTEHHRRFRRDSKATHGVLRREIDLLKTKLSGHANNDKGQESKKSQQSQQLQQIQDATKVIDHELRNLASSSPEDSSNHGRNWDRRKASFNRSRQEEAQAREELQRTRQAQQTQLATVAAESSEARLRRKKLQSRVDRLTAQHTSLTTTPSSSRSSPSAALDRRKSTPTEQAATRSLERQQFEVQADAQCKQLEQAISELRVGTVGAQKYFEQLVRALQAALQNQHASPMPPTAQLA